MVQFSPTMLLQEKNDGRTGVFIKLRMTAQSCHIILVIMFYSVTEVLPRKG